jgi:hypothetical protein
MAEQLGKIEKPFAGPFKQGKKLYLVPLIYLNEDPPPEYKEKCNRYWQQVAEQLGNLEAKIGKVSRIYHESISQSGDDGARVVERANLGSYQIVKDKCDSGAVLEAFEEKELLEEVMDWERCLLFGFISQKVASKIAEFYLEAAKKRYEFMAKRINETLKDDEAGLLFIREGHQLQFPGDIEVFSVFPPALDEIHRWLRDQARAKQEEAEEKREEAGKAKEKGEGAGEGREEAKSKRKGTEKKREKVED